MKKILAILMMLCLMVSAISVASITAFAAEAPTDAPDAGTVLRVSALKKDGTTIVKILDYDNFKDGWNYAMELAGDSEEMKKNAYDRIVVDIYTDWEANDDGQFSDDWIGGDGFDNDTICIPSETRVTLNLNNHTIDRDLSGLELDGEVIYVDEKANLIINDGTIKGGFSENGAGGIHIKNDANVTLNNVNIVGNKTSDDDGAGIAVYKGATLTMNGGSFKDNLVDVELGSVYAVQGSAVYVENGTAIFDGVTFESNHTGHKNIDGAAIYADEGDVTVKNCTFEGNGIENPDKKIVSPYSIIHSVDGLMTIINSNFTNNKASYLFYVDESDFRMEGGKITQNGGEDIFYIEDSDADIKNVTITDNVSKTIYVDNGNEVVTMVGCTLNKNATAQDVPDVNVESEDTLIFLDCTLGDTTVDEEDYVKVIYSGVAEEDAAISVTKLYKDGTKETDYYRFFEYGWNIAMEAAKTNTYERVIVDLYGDWKADDGQFTDDFYNGAGFDWDAIYIPANVRVTLNLNGHTIDRGLTSNEYNGEVICIDKNADVIINDGTITGGNSDTGAGGIHIKDGAKVTLNNVHIKDNTADGDNGAGIAMYNGATLTMNGGSFTSNFNVSFDNGCGAAIYVNNSTASFKDVRFYDNQFQIVSGHGAAVYAIQSTVTMDGCEIVSNGIYGKINEYNGHGSYSTIHITGGSTLTMKNTTIKGNGSSDYRDDVQPWQTGNDLSLIRVKNESKLFLDGCTITENIATDYVFSAFQTSVHVANTTITGNATSVFEGDIAEFVNCTFGNNAYGPTFDIRSTDQSVIFTDCELGDSSFNDRSRAIFDGAAGVGSIFGEGSLTNILVIISLIASGVSIFLTVYYNKKKAVPVAANGADESDDEE